jgi:hypothetical protein
MGQWLREKDLLILKSHRMLLRSALQKLGLQRRRVLSIIGKTRIIPRIRLYIPKEIRSRFAGFFPVEEHMADQNPLEGSIVWRKSKVIPVGRDTLYINRK